MGISAWVSTHLLSKHTKFPATSERERNCTSQCMYKRNKKAAAPKRQIKLRKKLGDEDNTLFPDESCNICFPFSFIY